MRRRERNEERERRDQRMPQWVRAAYDNLADEARKRLEDDAEIEAKIVDILARAAAEVRRS
jgi:hypothetical protein